MAPTNCNCEQDRQINQWRNQGGAKGAEAPPKIGQERLDGLILLAVHNQIEVKTDSVINILGQKDRKIMFVW